MIIQCPECLAQYDLGPNAAIAGRKVRCSQCGHIWQPEPMEAAAAPPPAAPPTRDDESAGEDGAERGEVTASAGDDVNDETRDDGPPQNELGESADRSSGEPPDESDGDDGVDADFGPDDDSDDQEASVAGAETEAMPAPPVSPETPSESVGPPPPEPGLSNEPSQPMPVPPAPPVRPGPPPPGNLAQSSQAGPPPPLRAGPVADEPRPQPGFGDFGATMPPPHSNGAADVGWHNGGAGMGDTRGRMEPSISHEPQVPPLGAAYGPDDRLPGPEGHGEVPDGAWSDDHWSEPGTEVDDQRIDTRPQLDADFGVDDAEFSTRARPRSAGGRIGLVLGWLLLLGAVGGGVAFAITQPTEVTRRFPGATRFYGSDTTLIPAGLPQAPSTGGITVKDLEARWDLRGRIVTLLVRGSVFNGGDAAARIPHLTFVLTGADGVLHLVQTAEIRSAPLAAGRGSRFVVRLLPPSGDIARLDVRLTPNVLE